MLSWKKVYSVANKDGSLNFMMASRSPTHPEMRMVIKTGDVYPAEPLK